MFDFNMKDLSNISACYQNSRQTWYAIIQIMYHTEYVLYRNRKHEHVQRT